MEPDDLYGVPLDAFVAERTALAKTLRADGRREEADAVKALRKPSVAAWAVNQLVRSDGLGDLVAAGDALRAAQEALLEGEGDAGALREAREAERTAVDALVESVTDVGGPALERVAETLHAAALNTGAREEVLGGRLVKELAHAGLGFEGVAEDGSPREKPAATPKRGEGTEAEARKAAERALKDATREADRAAKDVAQAETTRERADATATKAADAVERAEAKLADARERHDTATIALAEADTALTAARTRAADLAAARDDAQKALDA